MRLEAGRAPRSLPFRSGLAGRYSAASAAAFARAAALPAGILVLAVFLRLYNMAVVGWIPDNYEQITATQRLLSGEFPLSHIYPPGIALIMAPLFLILPQDLATMQIVILACSLGLVALFYWLAIHLTGDRWAAGLVGFAIAADWVFVHEARSPHYDSIIALAMTALLVAVPWMRGRSLFAYVAYGLAVALLVNIRPINAALLPALLIYWTGCESDSFAWKRIQRIVTSREVWAVCLTLGAVTVLLAVLGGWVGTATSRPDLTTYPGHLFFYAQVLVHTPVPFVTAPALLPLALVGIWRLGRLNRPLTLAMLFIVVTWPLLYAAFPWTSVRYMLPAKVFVWFFVALAPTQIWLWTEQASSRVRTYSRLYVATALAVLALLCIVPSGIMIHGWQTVAAESDEGSLRELRPVLAQLPDGSVVVSVSRAAWLEANPRLEYVDLMDYWLEDGRVTEQTRQELVDTIGRDLDGGKAVYFVHTRWEDGSVFVDGSVDFRRYFDSVEANFQITPRFTANALNLGLYRWQLSQVTRR